MRVATSGCGGHSWLWYLKLSATDLEIIGGRHKRDVKYSSAVAIIIGGKSDVAVGARPVNWTKYGGNSLMITVGKLRTGEYAVTVDLPIGQQRNQAVFCFGMDK
jgi:hypothetical protein